MLMVCPNDVSEFKMISEIKGIWCFLASKTWNNFSIPASFVGWDEAGTGWKKISQILFCVKMGFYSSVGSKSVLLSFSTLASWNLLQIRGPIVYCNVLSLFSYHINYIFFSDPQWALTKKENGTVLILHPEKPRHKKIKCYLSC